MTTFETIEITRGAGASGIVTLKVNGVAVNITGYTGRLVAKAKKTTADASAAINVALSIQTAASGIFSWSLSGVQTKALSPVTYVAEFHIQPLAGEPIKVQGLVDCTREVWGGS